MTNTNRTDVDRMVKAAVQLGADGVYFRLWKDERPREEENMASHVKASVGVIDAINLADILAAGEVLRRQVETQFGSTLSTRDWDAATAKLREGTG